MVYEYNLPEQENFAYSPSGETEENPSEETEGLGGESEGEEKPKETEETEEEI